MNIKDQFNNVSEKYDSQRRKLIPCYDDFYGISIENIELSNSQPKILDLGAGTGLFSQMILVKYPEAKIELIDLSDKMLEMAQSRFENNANITITKGDYTKLNCLEKYDAIVSSLSIHHLEDEDKFKLYKKIFSWLKPNGIFINAEQVLGESLHFENLYSKQWRNKVECSDLLEEEIISAYERVKLDKRSSLARQIEWLREVGFENVDCLYKYYDFAVIYAKKN